MQLLASFYVYPKAGAIKAERGNVHADYNKFIGKLIEANTMVTVN